MRAIRLPDSASLTTAGWTLPRRIVAVLLIILTGSAPVGAAANPVPVPSVADLRGDWTVDLRPTSDAPAYLKPMRLEVTSDNTVSGSFYESAITSGRADATKGRVCFAFTTSDASGPYQTAGCLVGREIEGQTWSEGRGFLLTWTATRAAP